MTEGLNVPKKESHLAPGVKPIISCIGTVKDFGFQESNLLRFSFINGGEGTSNAMYGATSAFLTKHGMSHSGEDTYVISPLDGKNKFSEKMIDCTGLVVAGIDQKTGEPISFISHQDPKRFLYDKKEDFLKHLREKLAEVKVRCKPGTIDAVVVGGMYIDAFNDPSKMTVKEAYVASRLFLSEEVRNYLGFDPEVINGPKISDQGDSIYFENRERRFYFIRPEVNSDVGGFDLGKDTAVG